MPRTPQQYEEIRKEKTTLILEAALKLFAEEGYHTTSISKIARKANISKGLMYNYFDSKEELLKAVIDDGLQKLISNFDLNNDNFLTDEEFIYFIETMFDIMEKDMHFWRIYFGLILQPGISEIISEKIQEWYQSVFVILIDFFIRKGIEDPQTEAMIFGAMLDGLGMNFIINPGLFPKEQIIQSIIKKYIKQP